MNIMLRSASIKCRDFYCFHAIVASFALYECYHFFSLYKNVGFFYLDVHFCQFFFSKFPPKICMWLLCLAHDTCQFGPTIFAGLRIQIVKLIIIQHPITTVLHTKFFPAPTSHAPPELFRCTGKPNISSV